MKASISLIFLGILLTCSKFSYSQDWSKLKLDPIKEKKFQPYLEIRHSNGIDYQTWKETNKFQYVKEMWYFSESFYVIRDYLDKGVSLNEEIIDISRFEVNRKQNEEAVVTLPGFKDAIILLPTNKLIYQP